MFRNRSKIPSQQRNVIQDIQVPYLKEMSKIDSTGSQNQQLWKQSFYLTVLTNTVDEKTKTVNCKCKRTKKKKKRLLCGKRETTLNLKRFLKSACLHQSLISEKVDLKENKFNTLHDDTICRYAAKCNENSSLILPAWKTKEQKK